MKNNLKALAVLGAVGFMGCGWYLHGLALRHYYRDAPSSVIELIDDDATSRLLTNGRPMIITWEAENNLWMIKPLDSLGGLSGYEYACWYSPITGRRLPLPHPVPDHLGVLRDK